MSNQRNKPGTQRRLSVSDSCE